MCAVDDVIMFVFDRSLSFLQSFFSSFTQKKMKTKKNISAQMKLSWQTWEGFLKLAARFPCFLVAPNIQDKLRIFKRPKLL